MSKNHEREHENVILTPAELRKKYELEDGAQRLLRPPTLLEMRKEARESGRYLPYGEEIQEPILVLNARRWRQRRRELEMKISEDYWSAKPPMSPIQGKDFGFIFKN
jgi:hypothetical protein